MKEHPPFARLVLEQVARVAGLRFDDGRLSTALAVVAEWIESNRISRLEDVDARAREQLLELLVVHESYFDRDLDQLEIIGRIALTELDHSHSHIRLWSAGCAGGEEAYSLAFMCVARGMLRRVSVLGTDLSAPALHRAAAGRYRNWSVRLGASTPAMRFLVQEGTEYVVPETIRRAVRFEQLNLVEDEFPPDQHVITCRNVLIYLSPAAVATVAAKLANALASDGWLFVAPSDPRLDDYADLVPFITDKGVHYRRRSGSARPVAAPIVRPFSPPQSVSTTKTTRGAPKSRQATTTQPVRPIVDADTVRFLADRGLYEEARQALRQALHAHPLDAEAHFLAAMLEEDARSALDHLERAAYLAPQAPLVHLATGHLHATLGDVKRSRRSYSIAIEMLDALPADSRVQWSDESPAALAAAARNNLSALQ